METNELKAIQDAARVVAGNPVILDTETTGIDETARIVSVSIISMTGQVLLDTLINPESPIPAAATNVHGITDAMVQGAPTWPHVAPHVSRILEDTPLTGYNITYDLRMLDHMDRFYGLAPTCPTLHPIDDAMLIYAEYYGDWNNYHGNYRWQKLTKAVEQLGIEVDLSTAHQAKTDCELTRLVLLNLAARWQSHTELQVYVADLAAIRKDEAEASEALSELRSELEASDSWKYWRDRLDAARKVMAELTNELRQKAKDAYRATGSKAPHPAVTIRMSTRLEYDPETARTWCSDHLPKAMVLDEKFFEQHAKAVAKTYPIDFVTIVLEPHPTIATDLSAYLPEPAGSMTVELDDEPFDRANELPFPLA